MSSSVNGRILVVDDSAAWLDLIDAMLHGIHARVCSTAKPREALAIARLFEFDVAIIDCVLDDPLSGPDVASSLRCVRPDIRCILITGYPREAVRERARAAGFSAILEKPFEAPTLRAAVAAALAASP